MSQSHLDDLIVDTLVEDYGWDEGRAGSAVAAWHAQGSPNNDEDVPNIAERLYQKSLSSG